jgi:hypothetical protein
MITTDLDVFHHQREIERVQQRQWNLESWEVPPLNRSSLK